jgi:hypothetical protein
MATQQELDALTANWSLVIKEIYPDIGVIVKGDPGSIASLLSVWSTGDPTYDEPTEPELLSALATVLDAVASQEMVEVVQSGACDDFTALPGWASWTGAEAETWIENNVTDLASAKTALKAMAKAIMYLRNHICPDLQGN